MKGKMITDSYTTWQTIKFIYPFKLSEFLKSIPVNQSICLFSLLIGTCVFVSAFANTHTHTYIYIYIYIYISLHLLSYSYIHTYVCRIHTFSKGISNLGNANSQQSRIRSSILMTITVTSHTRGNKKILQYFSM